jgi:ribosomal protein L10
MKGFPTIPTPKKHYAKILGGIQMPAAQICGTIHGLFQQVLGVLEARVDQLEGSAETAPGTNQ